MTSEQLLAGPRISIITVCLNAADYISQTIESVLSQTYPNLEYLIIDGGSRDGTVELIRRQEARLAYWHSRPDRGLAHAFNLGVAQAHGDWLLFLNADDFLLADDVVAQMAPHLAARPRADVVFGDTIMMSPQKDPHPLPLHRRRPRPWSWQKMRFSGIFYTIPHQSAFTNRSYFQRVGLFDESFRITVDYEHFLRGGKHLRAEYAPVAVSGMRVGGLAGRNLLVTFREIRRAQEKDQALPGPLAWASFYAMLGRYFVSRLGHLVLDPLASRITWSGRVSRLTTSP
jgi:glycosyltransferase involved in cell wall biosynthesis